MKITYLQHSGFAVEFDTFSVLFDAISTPIPPLGTKNLCVGFSCTQRSFFGCGF